MKPQRENTPLYALGLPCSEGGGRRSNFESRQEVGCKARFKSGEKLRRLSTSLSRSVGGRGAEGGWTLVEMTSTFYGVNSEQS